jgi:hypothetical protein
MQLMCPVLSLHKDSHLCLFEVFSRELPSSLFSVLNTTKIDSSDAFVTNAVLHKPSQRTSFLSVHYR